MTFSLSQTFKEEMRSLKSELVAHFDDRFNQLDSKITCVDERINEVESAFSRRLETLIAKNHSEIELKASSILQKVNKLDYAIKNGPRVGSGSSVSTNTEAEDTSRPGTSLSFDRSSHSSNDSVRPTNSGDRYKPSSQESLLIQGPVENESAERNNILLPCITKVRMKLASLLCCSCIW